MQIETVWKTSKGYFSNLQDALLKSNRQKDTNPHSQTFNEYETPVSCMALCHNFVYYELKELEVN